MANGNLVVGGNHNNHPVLEVYRMIKAKSAGNNAYGEPLVELVNESENPVVSLTSVANEDGTLRVTATVTRNIAKDIIDGLRLLDVVRAVVNPGNFGPSR